MSESVGYLDENNGPVPVSSSAPLPVVGRSITVSGSITTPATNPTYAAGQHVANSATGALVTAGSLIVGRGTSGISASGMLRRFRLSKSTTSVTLASFRAHLFSSNPVSVSTVTITSAAQGVVTWTGTLPTDGAPIVFTTTGALPTNITAGTIYYVKTPAAGTFFVSTTPGGAAIDTTAGAQSGVHTGNSGVFVGDTTALNTATAKSGAAAYLGRVDITIDEPFADGAVGHGTPATGTEINFNAKTVYFLLEARAAYVRPASEVFTLSVEDLQN